MTDFVQVKRKDSDSVASVPAKAVDHWREKGWETVEADESTPTPVEATASTTPVVVPTVPVGQDTRTAAGESAEKNSETDPASGRRTR